MFGSHKRTLLLLLVLTSMLFFAFLGSYGLLEPDEGRYAEIPREMLVSGDFITPHLNYVKYFEKPVLHYWLTASAMKVFGMNEFAARVWPALLAVAGVGLTYLLARQLYGTRAAFFSGCVLATSLEYFALAHLNIIDMPLSVFLTAALVGFVLGHNKDKRYYYLFYIGMALATLSKGLIGIVLPLMVVAVWLVITRRWQVLRELINWRGIALFLFISVPWFVVVSLHNEEFFWFFFVREHFLRYATKFAQRYQPPYFFVVIVIAGFVPWTGIMLSGLKKWWPTSWRNLGKQQVGELFLLLWALLIFVFFSISDSKLATYILPIFPVLAIATGKLMEDFLCGQSRRLFKCGLIINSVLLVVLALTAVGYVLLAKQFPINVLLPLAIPVVLLLVVSTVVTWLYWFKQRNRELVVALIATGFLLGIALQGVLGFYGHIKSSKELADVVAHYQTPETVVVDYHDYDQGLPFYLGRRVVIVGYKGELEFGSEIGDQSAWFINDQQFLQLWNSDKKVIAVINPKDQQVFATPGTAYVLGNDYRKIVVANKPLEGK